MQEQGTIVGAATSEPQSAVLEHPVLEQQGAKHETDRLHEDATGLAEHKDEGKKVEQGGTRGEHLSAIP